MISMQRVFFSNNGVISDASLALDDYRALSFVMPFVAAEDALYVASTYPFNHKFFDIAVVNALASNVLVDIWFNDAWEPAVDILDSTSVGGKSLAQSGIIRWNTAVDKGWQRVPFSYDIAGLSSTRIYDMMWIRLRWSNDITATTALNYLGHKFSDDQDLYSFYPDLNNASLKTAFASGKVDWNEQAYTAAQAIIRDLKRKQIVVDASQLLEHELFLDASIHKVAEIIYSALGEPYKANKDEARKAYSESMDMRYFMEDKNANGYLSLSEKSGSRLGRLSR